MIQKLKALIFFLVICFETEASSIIYGFSSGILPSETQESVFRGFLLALKNFEDVQSDRDLKLVYSNTGHLTSPIDVAKDVLKENPLIITGFPSSFESQLAAPILKDSGILTIFASSSNLSLENMSQNIYSSSESILIANTKIADEIKKKYKKNETGVVIYNPFDYFSVNQKITWNKIIKDNSELSLKFLATAPDGKLSSTQLDECKYFKYVITTLFPSKSYEFFRLFDEKVIDIPVYTNSSWYKMEYTSLKRFFLRKKTSVYLVQFKNLDSKVIGKISDAYKGTYKSNPSPEVFIGYDLGLIVGSILQRSKDLKVSPNEIMKKKPCFQGSPFGYVCFGDKGGFAPREISLVDINELN